MICVGTCLFTWLLFLLFVCGFCLYFVCCGFLCLFGGFSLFFLLSFHFFCLFLAGGRAVFHTTIKTCKILQVQQLIYDVQIIYMYINTVVQSWTPQKINRRLK